jgi:ABC-type uncharacterized transport system involved in gliding motility auxiliary subunit
MLMDPASLLDGFKPSGKRYTLAARVSGMVQSAFPDGPPAGVTLAPGQLDLKASTRPLNLIVFADADMLSDFLWLRSQNFFGQRMSQAMASNGDLVQNALDNLAGSADLISVRGRASFQRPFRRVEALRAQAEEHFRTTEQELETQLRQTEDKLTALQARRNDQSALILTPEQQQELERFQQEKLRIRKELREVRLNLDQDITRLGSTIKFVNIVLVPALFVILALLISWRRRRANAAALHAGSGGSTLPPPRPAGPVPTTASEHHEAGA